jgi:flagellin-like protein
MTTFVNASRRNRLGLRRNARRSKRGVSPIIATILLVAITVVLAAVLYVLVSGLTRTGASTPYELGMSETSATGSGTAYTIILAISPTSGLTTSLVGLKIVSVGGSTLTVGAAPAACKAYVAPSSCATVSSGWYVVLVGSNGTVFATYGSAGWGGYATGTTAVALNGGFQMWIESQSQYAGVGNTISAFGTGTSSVSGSATL